jgi:hypothetical protein
MNANTGFKVESKAEISGNPSSPGAGEQVWLYRRSLSWHDPIDGQKVSRPMVLQVARWVAQRAIDEGKGAIIPEAEGKRLIALQEQGEIPAYDGPTENGSLPEPEAPAQPGRMEALEEKVSAQDTKLDLILSLLSKRTD